MRRIMVIMGVLVGLVTPILAVPAAVSANAPKIDIFGACDHNSANSELCSKKDSKAEPIFKNIINLLLYILGILSVIMVVVGGLMYVTSAGDANKLAMAKNIIIYSVVGVVVALLAYAIVTFAFDAITAPATTSTSNP